MFRRHEHHQPRSRRKRMNIQSINRTPKHNSSAMLKVCCVRESGVVIYQRFLKGKIQPERGPVIEAIRTQVFGQ